MVSKELPDFAQRLLKVIVKDNGFCDYNMLLNSGSQMGDGFSSELFSISIIENKSDKRLDLVCKIALSNRNHRKEFLSSIAFNREVLFYTKFMPTFAKFQNEKNVPKPEQFSSYPKCYATVVDDPAEQFALILEDLRPCGFKLWNKFKPSPFENMCIALHELGKPHSLSVAMKDQRPDEFSEFKRMKDMKLFIRSQNMIDYMKSTYNRAIVSLLNEDHKNIMRHIRDNLVLYVEDCLNEKAAEPFGVLCHGKIGFFDFVLLYS